MIPGFVTLGALAVLAQLVLVVVLARVLRRWFPIASSTTQRRVHLVLGGGAVVLALGQVVALASLGTLWVSPLLEFHQATELLRGGTLGIWVGLLAVFAGVVLQVVRGDRGDG